MDRNEVRRAWDEVAETYAARRDPDGSDAALVDDLLDSLASDPAADGEDPLVLDVGCGDGARTLANLPPGSVGLDVSRRGLDLARETVSDARLVHGEMSALPFAADRFDGLTAYHAVFHVERERHPAVYAEFARVLRPGGRLLTTLPGGRFETVRRGWMGGRMFFSAPGRERTLDQLREAGFTDVETRTATDPLGSSTEFAFARLDPEAATGGDPDDSRAADPDRTDP
ncbi:class I SAM-dependent methyltransferase [Halorubrum sp. 2020YC2]|uniref:class I SAM-dependent methyltransferase n=1 Tax=Halorubrum sp. 2020YC2 TaxID=2836432 RepID=UPI001BE69936|nr:class I SAM-dependent methyltransferase [Halorubrum sp. 2020YC2]QWC19415.1 methyltransferase domain-containing protein [Halorubrum sp. 2020YC2]